MVSGELIQSMAIEFGTLKEALKASPFWLPLNPLPASVDMESFFFQNFYFIYSEAYK